MAVEKEQTSAISVEEHVPVKILESGNHCFYTPPYKLRPKETEIWMAPRKPVRRNVYKVVRAESGEMRVMKDNLFTSKNVLTADDFVDLTGGSLRSFPMLEMMATGEADDGHSMAQLGKSLLVDEEYQLLEASLRFCPSFERRYDDDRINTCKRRVELGSLHPFICPALVRH